MVSGTQLESILTGLALYTLAALMVGYFGVNAYTGEYGLNARQELDQEIIALASELARLKKERAAGEQRVSLLRSASVDPDMWTSGAASSSITSPARPRPDDRAELDVKKVSTIKSENQAPTSRIVPKPKIPS